MSVWPRAACALGLSALGVNSCCGNNSKVNRKGSGKFNVKDSSCGRAASPNRFSMSLSTAVTSSYISFALLGAACSTVASMNLRFPGLRTQFRLLVETTPTTLFLSVSPTNYFPHKCSVLSATVCFYFPQRQSPLSCLTDSRTHASLSR